MARSHRKFAARPKPDSESDRTPQQRWNDRRTALFFDHLALTCNVNESLRRSGLSSSNMYRRRSESADFRAAWDAALEEGYSRLEAELLNRALNGETQEVVNRNGEVVKVRTVSNTLGLALLKHHAVRVAAIRALKGTAHDEQAIQMKMKFLKRLEQLTHHRAEQAERGEPPPNTLISLA
jgi:hypothetical protein